MKMSTLHVHLKCIIILTFLTFCNFVKNTSNVVYYENIINKQIDDEIHYKFPKDASSYRPTNGYNNIKGFGTFDFIVIGAGATGSVIANRLSENEKWRILLLEAGSFGNDISDIPAMGFTLTMTNFTWPYKSTSQTTACLDMPHQKCFYPRGRGVGGSTLINGLVYARGCKKDYDKWSESNPGWSYEEVLPYFKKSENIDITDSGVVIDNGYHGTGGELNVACRNPRHPQMTRWLRANQEKAYKIIDYNGKENIGASITQINTKNGRRCDDGTAFVKLIRTRPNLNVSTESFVTKIAINNTTKTAHGVEFTLKGQKYLAKAKKEIILSAGAIASPQLLMLSGVGPSEHLLQKNIPVIQNLNVGSTLRDHPAFWGLYFDANYTQEVKPLSGYIREYLNGKGSMTVLTETDGLGFYQTKFEKEPNYPDLEIIIIPVDGFFRRVQNLLSEKAFEKTWTHLNQFHAFNLQIFALHSRSIGSVRLKSNDPYDFPLIDANLLSDSENRDIDTLYEGIQLGLSLMNTKAFQEVNATVARQVLPACDDKPYLSKSYWHCALRYYSGHVYHQIATCPMGPDPSKGAVVDAQAKVHGINNLRVADASIIPFPLSGHPNAPCVMIGEKISDLVKEQHKVQTQRHDSAV